MKLITIRNKKVLEAHFRKNTPLNLYQLGDLDDFFYPFTEWKGLENDGKLLQAILIYRGTELPVLIALYDNKKNNEREEMIILVDLLKEELPERFYSHISTGLKELLIKDFELESHGKYLKMSLKESEFLKQPAEKGIRRLSVSDLEEILEFYEKSYPDNWFDKRMLETQKYFGYYADNKLIGISGIHVYSAEYRIAALGNIATDPGHRRKSVCAKVTSALCDDLFNSADVIGLNVSKDNTAAIKSYEKLGFRVCDEFEECMFWKKGFNRSPQRL